MLPLLSEFRSVAEYAEAFLLEPRPFTGRVCCNCFEPLGREVSFCSESCRQALYLQHRILRMGPK